MNYKPEVLIIGTGANGFMEVDDQLKDQLKALAIESVIKKTSEAVMEYNRVSKNRKIVFVLHSSC